jgi:hypothetical protein
MENEVYHFFFYLVFILVLGKNKNVNIMQITIKMKIETSDTVHSNHHYPATPIRDFLWSNDYAY